MTPTTDPITRLESAAQSLAGAPFPGPRRTALLARFYRVAAPLLEEREQLRAGVAHGYERISEERTKRGAAPGDPDPQDTAYQQGVDRWRGWVARLQEIDDALTVSAERAGIKLFPSNGSSNSSPTSSSMPP